MRFVVVEPPDGWKDAAFGYGHMLFRGRSKNRSKNFVDPSLVAPVGWPCRTTLVKKCEEGAQWLALEVCEPWGLLGDATATLPHGECEVITVLTRDATSPVVLPDGRSAITNWPQPKGPFDNDEDDYEPDAVAEDEVEIEGADEPQPVPDLELEVPKQAEREPEVIHFDGVELSLSSSLAALQAACKRAGVSQSGGKQRCWDRLRGFMDKQRLLMAAEAEAAVEADRSRIPVGQAMVKEPTAAEKRLHNLTHWPYAVCGLVPSLPDDAWCRRQAPKVAVGK